MDGRSRSPFVIAGTDLPPFRPESRKTCPQCGGKFACTANWGYGIGGVDYCSWKCVRAAEKKSGVSRKIHASSPFIGHMKEIRARLAAGESLARIAQDFDRSGTALRKWLEKQPQGDDDDD